MAFSLLEHLNMEVGDRETALAFYSALGCVVVPDREGKTLHVNCGAMTQFHLPCTGLPAQQWRGGITIAYATQAGLDDAVTSLTSAGHSPIKGASGMEVTGPYGNTFRLMVAETHNSETCSRYNATAVDVALHCVDIKVPSGSAEEIAVYYREVFGWTAEANEGTAVVCSEVGQKMTFTEDESPQFGGGEHLAVYIKDYETVFDRAHAKGLIWVNPKFSHFDDVMKREDAIATGQFRLKDITDSTGKVLLELEHEVRNVLTHPSCPFAKQS